MKLELAMRELHRSETSLARDLLQLSDRHTAETEVHYVARQLAAWSASHVKHLASAAERHGVHLNETVARHSGPLAPLRTVLGELTSRRPEPGLLLLADLRRVHRKAAGVSLDWELLAQGAQAAKDSDLVQLTQQCHPRTLRQVKWTNAMLKTLSPQILTS